MRVLYGVQGTGNGHLTRARAMAAAFRATGLNVDYLFSGRDPLQFFDMQCFGAYRTRPGLTFVHREGRVDYWRTFRHNRYGRFVRDVMQLDLQPYDLILTDFEPVTAWAGRLRRKFVISMGHQPAFDFAIPVAGDNLLASFVMRAFAPGRMRLGMHWDKFDAPILPPLIEPVAGASVPKPNKILVYLPFEAQKEVERVLRQLPAYECFVYAPGYTGERRGNLHLRAPSVAGFREDLRDCEAVICNAGFELASECLSLGKRLLVKPLGGQMEQISNALALQRLGYASALTSLDVNAIRDWLQAGLPAVRMEGPDIAKAIALWLERGDYRPEALAALSDALWRKVTVNESQVWPRGESVNARVAVEKLGINRSGSEPHRGVC